MMFAVRFCPERHAMVLWRAQPHLYIGGYKSRAHLPGSRLRVLQKVGRITATCIVTLSILRNMVFPVEILRSKVSL